jgi:L-asparaginase
MKVALFTLGGTIASTGPAAGGVTPRLTGADLLTSVPGLERTGAEVMVHDFRQVPSSSLTIDDILDLAAAIRDQTSPDGDGAGVDGVVVSQGTDTIEETSFLLDLVYDGDAPVVFTGAMRNPTLAGADGPANLLAAVTVAAAPQARGLGVLVVLGDELHAARFVRKAHTTSVTAFVSPPAGPLGFVAEGRVVVLTRPDRRPPLPLLTARPSLPSRALPPRGQAVRTGVVTMVLGDDGALLKAAASGCDGLVVAGYGAGHVPAAVVDQLDRVARRIPVVLASRTGAGTVLARTYDYPGSERDLRYRGLIGAGFLDPLKARLLLHLLLTAGATRDEIAAGFAATGADSGHTQRS